MDHPKLTPISELGEFGLIKRLTKNFNLKNPSSVKGVGDDAAVIDCGEKQLIVTTDMLVEGVHFDLVYMPLKHLGYKSAVVNFSDVYAMNGKPKQLLISIAVSSRFSAEGMDELYTGLHAACEKYGVDLVGGDTVSSKTGMIINITAIGEATKEDIVYRSTAKKGDLICVSGNLGGAYAGLLILEREKKIFLDSPGVQPDLQGKDYIIRRQLLPDARADIIDVFKELGIKPTSMIDISDGLSSEAMHLCHESGLSCKIYEEKIPIHQMTYQTARELNLDATMCAMNGGEDYELLFTLSQSDYEKIKDKPGISIIGFMADASEGSYLESKSKTLHKLTAQGWEAFRHSNR